jgi:hypothetical protein
MDLAQNYPSNTHQSTTTMTTGPSDAMDLPQNYLSNTRQRTVLNRLTLANDATDPLKSLISKIRLRYFHSVHVHVRDRDYDHGLYRCLDEPDFHESHERHDETCANASTEFFQRSIRKKNRKKKKKYVDFNFFDHQRNIVWSRDRGLTAPHRFENECIVY